MVSSERSGMNILVGGFYGFLISTNVYVVSYCGEEYLKETFDINWGFNSFVPVSIILEEIWENRIS